MNVELGTVGVIAASWQTYDERSALRIVGYYEYSHALQKFDELVRTATPEELEVIDQLIAERAELAIATNLSAKVPHPPNVLDEVSTDPNDTFVRQGLAWLMALARTEVAAVTAGFTAQKDPFRYVGATEFELPAYTEMLVDGLRTHYWALSNDADLPRYRKGRGQIHQLMVYGRRLFMMREMLRAAQMLSQNATPEQVEELQSWDQNLEHIQTDIVFAITEYIRRAPGTDKVQVPCPKLESAVQSSLSNPVSAGAPSKTTLPNATGAVPEAPQNPN